MSLEKAEGARVAKGVEVRVGTAVDVSMGVGGGVEVTVGDLWPQARERVRASVRRSGRMGVMA